MSVQNPTIPTATQAKGIDSVVLDLQTHLDTELVWLTNGMGRAYRLTKVEVNKAAFFLPEVYLGTDQFKYFAATPDNDKTGQSIIVVGTETYVNQQAGFYGVLSYPVSIIFSVNMSLIDSTLLETDYFEEHQIEDVREALIRGLLGKSYRLTVDEVVRDFDEVYSEFDVSRDRGIAHAPMSYFRFNCTVLVREDCLGVSLNRCGAILQNLTTDDKNTCILPTYDFSDTTVQANVTAGQQTDLTTWLCGATAPTPYSMTFDGVNDTIQTNISYAAYELERTDTFSVGMWIKMDSIGGFEMVISKYDTATTRGWYMAIETTGKVRVSLQSTSSTNGFGVNSTNSISAGVWTHIGFTYTGNSLASGVVITIDGAPEVPIVVFDTLSATILKPTFRTTIAGASSGGVNYAGLIDEVRMWDITKSPANMLIEGTLPMTDPTDPASLIMQNKMGDASTDSGTAIFNGLNWCFLDSSLTVDGYSSANMGSGNRTVDVPV